jgi:tripartite-type tricarboxylate transporter receptor subunit TctC
MGLMKGIILLAALWIAVPCSAIAQTYPNRPINLVVPFPPGGGADGIARILSQKMSESIGQQVVVFNRDGAGGNIGADFVAKASPDGYTLLLTNVAVVINSSVKDKLQFDIVKDFVPVAPTGTNPMVLAVNPSLQVHSVQELIVLLKSQPGKMNYSSCGNATIQHLGGEMLKQLVKIDMTHVPYRGCAAAVVDGLNGQVPILFNTISTTMAHHRAGKLRILGVASAKPSPSYSEIATIASAGIGGYDADVWSGVLAPAGTPKDIVSRLNLEINRVMGLPDVQEKYRSQFFDPAAGTPEQFAAMISAELMKWRKLIEDAGIKVN